MAEGRSHHSRVIALTGPYGAGKTALLEAMLLAAGATSRKGGVGDPSAEARDRGMSTEMTAARMEWMGDRYQLLDAPGSIEFAADAEFALPGADLAIVVAEPDPDKATLLQPAMKRLERLGVPHLLFVNKIDQASGSVTALLEALQAVSEAPLVARQIPLRDGETISGFIDLALERAFVYRPDGPSEQIDIPEGDNEREADARFHMLEQLADFDDHLMEELLSDIEPSREEVFGDLVKEMQASQIVPVLFGSAENGFGVRRLMKALRHETPDVAAAAARLGADAAKGAAAYVVKTLHAGQSGKLSVARILKGEIKDGATLTASGGESARIGGLFAVQGAETTKLSAAEAGDLVALGRLDAAATGDLVAEGEALPRPGFDVAQPVYALAMEAGDRDDEVKLGAAMTKLSEEDPSLRFEPEPDTGEFLLRGQGEVHLAVAAAKLKRKFGLDVVTRPALTPYKESIRKPATVRGKHKKQSGGHGQYGDVEIAFKPLPRGSGFQFEESISGGVVPKTYFSAVEAGVRDAMERGPLGFPVVDVSATLVDGSHHSVDSSDLAFRLAGRQAAQQAFSEAGPVLLEPVWKVTLYAPSDSTSRLTSILSSRRGQILGFDAREGWCGWEAIEAYLPQAELGDLIIELRSATQGVGAFEAAFDHMAELTGKLADEVAEQRRQAA